MFKSFLFTLLFTLALSPGRGHAGTTKLTPTPTVPLATYKSFRQWKNEKIQEALGRLNTTKLDLDYRKISQVQGNSKTEAQVGKDVKLNHLQAQMRLDLISMELAKDLTVTDYFVGYVNKIQEKKEFINDIAGKMTSDEVAELMTAYAQSIFGSGAMETPKCATNQDSKNSGK